MSEAYLHDREALGRAAGTIARTRDAAKHLAEVLGRRIEEPLHKITETDLYAFLAAAPLLTPVVAYF